jgi:hypothetical protein
MQIQNIPIDQIYLDLQNPRSKFSNPEKEVEDPFDARQQTLTMALLRQQEGDGASGYSVNALKDSIINAGGIVSPIWIKKLDGSYICMEGNTRLMIYKTLANEDPENPTWKEIPAIVYDQIDAQQENALKLTAHIVGTREWKPYNKAKYIVELMENSTFTWDEISAQIGGQVSSLKTQVAAVRDFDKYYLSRSGETSNNKFSHYVELKKNIKAQEAMDEHEITDEIFADWVLDNKFQMAINVRKLPEILNTPQALDAFKNDNFAAAKEFLSQPQIDIGQVSILDLSEEIQKKLTYSDIQRIYDDKTLIQSLLGLGESLNSTWDALDNLGRNPDENVD